MYTYEIGGITFTQSRLKYGALLQLVRLFRGLTFGGEGLDGIDFDRVMELLENEDLALGFLRIVLDGPKEQITFDSLGAQTVAEVTRDFLSCNGKIVPTLIDLVKSTASLAEGVKGLNAVAPMPN